MARIKYKDENGVWQYADKSLEEVTVVEADVPTTLESLEPIEEVEF